jgi:hypothetical protein
MSKKFDIGIVLSPDDESADTVLSLNQPEVKIMEVALKQPQQQLAWA